MVEILSYTVTATIVSAVVQVIKKNTAHNPLIILAVISVFAATIYTFLSQTQYWDAIVQNFLIVASAANMVYNAFKPFFQDA